MGFVTIRFRFNLIFETSLKLSTARIFENKFDLNLFGKRKKPQLIDNKMFFFSSHSFRDVKIKFAQAGKLNRSINNNSLQKSKNFQCYVISTKTFQSKKLNKKKEKKRNCKKKKRSSREKSQNE